jgi:hypothetical protein
MEAEESSRELLVYKLSALQRKEDELASLIQSIDATFMEMGFRIDNSVSVLKKKGAPSSGIRMKGKLSFRGKEKAEEYFDVMDLDRDGFLNFEDFRGMAYGIWHMPYTIRHMAYGIWHTAYGIRHMAYGIWHVHLELSIISTRAVHHFHLLCSHNLPVHSISLYLPICPSVHLSICPCNLSAIRAFSDPYSFVDAPEMQSNESWQLHMADSGIAATPKGGITKEQYRIYR